MGWDENSINIDEVAERLQDIGVQALTIHARTRAQMYKGHSDWSHIQRVKENPRITMPILEMAISILQKSFGIQKQIRIRWHDDWSRCDWLSLDF